MQDQVRVVKGNLEIVDSFFYGGDKAMAQLKADWTTPAGHMAKYFKDKYGISFTLVNSFEQHRAEKRYKKITDDGIVGIVVKIV